MIRARSATLVALVALSLALPAWAAPIAAPAQARPGLAARALGGLKKAGAAVGRKLGQVVARQFRMRDEMKLSLTDAKALRKDGMLTGAAETLRDAPKAEGLRERFAAWRAKKLVMRAARTELKAKLGSDPGMGYAAMQTFKDAGMTSFIDRARANGAMAKGAKNAVSTAKRLGNKGRFGEAYEMLQWSMGERELDQRAVQTMVRLYGQAMKASDRAATRYVKAMGEADRQAAFNQVFDTIEAASTFSAMAKAATGEDPFDQARAGRIAQRMGMSGEEFGKIMAHEYAQAPAGEGAAMSSQPAEQAAAQAPAATSPAHADSTQLTLDFEGKGAQP